MGRSFAFEVVAGSGMGPRAGLLHTPHGSVPTPAFMPVASQATVKTLTPQELRELGVPILVANAYHLYLRPGVEVIQALGGLHRFMAWEGPLLTDSGGFQVFSLAHLRRLNDEGILFTSHLDGSEHFLSPEKAVQIQEGLGADIIMALDECAPYPCEPAVLEEAMERTHRWAERSLRAQSRRDQALFAIVQGGTLPELRRRSAHYLASLDFPGYAVGGLSLGEPKATTWHILEETIPWLPTAKPRYLMGVGSPEDLFEGVARGVDLFDSALSTRVARNGALFTRKGRCNIRNASLRDRDDPIEEGCDCYTCRNFSAAYLHHLFKGEELLAYRLATLHNLRFLTSLMERMRTAILEGSFEALKESFLASYQITDEETRRVQKQRWTQSQRTRSKPPTSEPPQ